MVNKTQRRSRRVMGRQLARRAYHRAVGVLPMTDIDHLEAEVTKFFQRDWSAAQDFNVSVANGNNGRLDAMHCRSAIHDQRNQTVQLAENVLRGRRADSAKAICARSGHRLSKKPHDLIENRVRADSYCDCL